MSFPCKTKSMCTNLFLLFGGLVCALLLYYTYTSHQQYTQNTMKLANGLIDQMNVSLIEKTTNYLMPAITMAESSSRLVEEGALNLKDRDQLEAYAMGILKPLPHLNGFYIGDKYGNFIMTKRTEDKTIQTKIINRSTQQHTVTIKDRNEFGQLIKTYQDADLSYDPRQRPWYIGAKEFEQRYWTDVYLFYTDKKPGITAAYPAYDKNKQFYGVFGVDIQLDYISQLLSSENLSPESIVLIVNDKNKVIAYPKKKNLYSSAEDLVDPLHISELNSEIITKAFSEYEDIQQSKFLFEQNRRKYLGSFKPFPDYFGKKWKIVLIIPVDTLVDTKISMNRSFYSTVLLALGLVLLASWFFSRRHNS